MRMNMGLSSSAPGVPGGPTTVSGADTQIAVFTSASALGGFAPWTYISGTKTVTLGTGAFLQWADATVNGVAFFDASKNAATSADFTFDDGTKTLAVNGSASIATVAYVGTADPADFFSFGTLNVFTVNNGGIVVSDTSGATFPTTASGLTVVVAAEPQVLFADGTVDNWPFAANGIMNVAMSSTAVAGTWLNSDTSGNRDFVQHLFGSYEAPMVSAKGTFEFQNSGQGDGTAWFGFNFDWNNTDLFLLASDGSFLPGNDNAQDIGNPASAITAGANTWRTGYFGTSVVSPLFTTAPVAVASLPSAVTSGAGARAVVNDALAPAFGVAVADMGLVTVPVYSNGTIWLVG